VGIQFSRVFAMPSKHTFTIKPIEELMNRYVKEGEIWADPFSGWNSPATYTNDLNPEAPTTSHIDAEDFTASLVDGELDGFIFDPPYSPRQISEVYGNVGRKVGMEETQSGRLYRRVKTLAHPKIKPNGIVICCGWNSAGFGKERGFEMIEVLLVFHGGGHNDTIITVERKLQQTMSLT
jgi:hypothetical protein